MQLALGRIAGNPVEALEAVDGHFELLLVGPSAPPASPAQQREALPHSSSGTGMCSAQSSGNYSVFSCGSSLTAVPSASSSGHRAASIDLGTLSQRGAAAACPAAAAAAGPRISVVSADATTRHLLHAMLSSSLDAVATPGGARASLSPPLPSVDADPSALAFTDVVVLHVAARMLPSFAIDADSLPRRPDGSLLGYILVGEFSAEFEDAISSSFAGWIETARARPHRACCVSFFSVFSWLFSLTRPPPTPLRPRRSASRSAGASSSAASARSSCSSRPSAGSSAARAYPQLPPRARLLLLPPEGKPPPPPPRRPPPPERGGPHAGPGGPAAHGVSIRSVARWKRGKPLLFCTLSACCAGPAGRHTLLYSARA